METYRLSSRLTENNTDYLIQTANDAHRRSVGTNVFVNGTLTEVATWPHPGEAGPEEVMSLVDSSHNEKKKELETLFQTSRQVVDSGNPRLMFQLGVAFYHKAFYAEAMRLFKNTLAIDPDYHQALSYLGRTELALGEVKDAIKTATLAADKQPGYADYQKHLGEAFLADSDCTRAIQAFEQAVSINLYYGEAYFCLGLAYVLNTVLNADLPDGSEQLARATDVLNKAALLDAGYRGETLDSGLETLRRGDNARALSVFQTIAASRREKRRQEFATFYMKVALFPGLMSEKTVVERIRFLETEIDKHANYPDLHAELASCYLEQARILWQKGVDEYRKTHQMNPSLSRIRFATEEAEKTYEEMGITLKKIGESR
jgi:tetratricopeptide (TPR) repeat protein